MLDINLFGAPLGALAAVPYVDPARRQGGAIVLLSSIGAVTGSANEYVFYVVAKGGVNSLTIGLAREVAKEGIRVNGVRPGPTDTGSTNRGAVARAAAAHGARGPAGRSRRGDPVSLVGRRLLRHRGGAQRLGRALGAASPADLPGRVE